MVVRIRLQRMGVRNTPFYRIVAADARAPRDGKFLEKVIYKFIFPLIYPYLWHDLLIYFFFYLLSY